MRADDPVAEIMTESVLSIEVTEPIREAVRLLSEYPVHHLPVVNRGMLVGMLSSADMLKLEFFAPRGQLPGSDYINERLRIETVMRKEVVSVESSRVGRLKRRRG